MDFEIEWDGWIWSRYPENHSEWFEFYTKIKGDDCCLRFSEDSKKKLEKRLEKTGNRGKLKFDGENFYYENSGWRSWIHGKKVKLDWELPININDEDMREMREEMKTAFHERFKDISEIEVELQRDTSKYTYRRRSSGKREIVSKNVEPYLQKLESLVGKEVAVSEIMPSQDLREKYTIEFMSHHGEEQNTAKLEITYCDGGSISTIETLAVLGTLKYEGRIIKNEI